MKKEWRCDQCEFFCPCGRTVTSPPGDGEEVQAGQCRVEFPPFQAPWPSVIGNQWCGRWTPKTKEA